jgi:hypothetical protein
MLGLTWVVQEQIKSLIVDLMLSAPPKVRAQLSEALSIISSHDFPAKWQSLLPLLIEKLKTDDQQLVNGVLSTADSIYHRYRCGGAQGAVSAGIPSFNVPSVCAGERESEVFFIA